MRVVFATTALLLLACAPARAGDAICDAPDALIESYARLPRVSQAVKRDKKLEILVVSATPSQTGSASALKNYPAFLQESLRKALTDVDVNVFAHAEARKSIKEVTASFPKLLEDLEPRWVGERGNCLSVSHD